VWVEEPQCEVKMIVTILGLDLTDHLDSDGEVAHSHCDHIHFHVNRLK